MNNLIDILLLLLPYCIGAIPAAVWISKLVFGSDIRSHGSGNAGSTNMYRVHGFKAGLATQIIDLSKGAVAAAIPKLFVINWHLPFMENMSLTLVSLIFGLLAVIGHIYPIWAGFRGGKGVNTLLGMMLVVNPIAAGICVAVFMVTLLASSYVSLGSLLGTLAFPIQLIVIASINDTQLETGLIIAATFMFLLVVFTHRTNLNRLLSGTENKAGFLKKK